MSRTIGILPGAVAFLAGVAAGMLTGGGRHDYGSLEPDAAPSTSQARSIDTLKTRVTQTDILLERILESLDSLQTSSDKSEFAEVFSLQQLPA